MALSDSGKVVFFLTLSPPVLEQGCPRSTVTHSFPPTPSPASLGLPPAESGPSRPPRGHPWDREFPLQTHPPHHAARSQGPGTYECNEDPTHQAASSVRWEDAGCPIISLENMRTVEFPFAVVTTGTHLMAWNHAS